MGTLSRRDFLKLSGVASALTALWACNPMDSLGKPGEIRSPIPRANPTPDVGDTVRSVLRRITYGPVPDEIERARTLGIQAYISEQLDPASIPDIDMGEGLASFRTLQLSPAELINLEDRALPARELVFASLWRMLYSKRQLYERMVEFWSDHFNIFIGKDLDLALKTVDDREVIRPNALGNFYELLSASAHSPAMLFFLDNQTNDKAHPNENYARELMELHTLGVDGGYSQADVQEVARALTGWSIVLGRDKSQAGHFEFRPDMHDYGEKQILGQSFQVGTGVEEGERLLSILAGHPSTGRFIAGKLIRRFVDDQPMVELTSQLAEVFMESKGNIPAVLSVLFGSQEFLTSLGRKLKRPIEFIVSALRLTGARVEFDRNIYRFLELMGQPPFGWPAPNGFPDSAGAWLGSSSLMGRWNFSLALAFGSLYSMSVDWAAQFDATAEPEIILDALGDRLLLSPVPEPGRSIILDTLRSTPGEFVIPTMAALILSSPYFQYH